MADDPPTVTDGLVGLGAVVVRVLLGLPTQGEVHTGCELLCRGSDGLVGERPRPPLRALSHCNLARGDPGRYAVMRRVHSASTRRIVSPMISTARSIESRWVLGLSTARRRYREPLNIVGETAIL